MNDTFFVLLRSGLWGTVPKLSEDEQVDWRYVIDTANKQTVLGFIADAVTRLDPRQQPGAEMMQGLRKFVMRNLMTHVAMNRNVREVVSRFRGNGVDVILLKGQGLAQCYLKPELRQCGDIDLYVGEKYFAKAAEVAKSMADNGSLETNYKHTNFDYNGIEVEVHRIPILLYRSKYNKAFRRFYQEQLDGDRSKLKTMKVGDAEVFLPSPTFDALFVFLHAFGHLLKGGVGFRQICDWAMYIHKYTSEIDWVLLTTVLREIDMVRPWSIWSTIAVDYLGLPKEDIPGYRPETNTKLVERTVRLVMYGGNFGQFRDNRHHFSKDERLLWKFVKKYIDMNRWTIDAITIAPGETLAYYRERVTTGLKELLFRH